MQETRQNKIARLLQKELSLIFQQQTRATHGVMISVTRTKISPDLSICTAYLSVFPSNKGEEILANINANSKQIRYELGTRVRNQMRIIPELRFFIPLLHSPQVSLFKEIHSCHQRHQWNFCRRCCRSYHGFGSYAVGI